MLTSQQFDRTRGLALKGESFAAFERQVQGYGSGQAQALLEPVAKARGV